MSEVDSLTVLRTLMKSHLMEHVQDIYHLSMQYIDLKSLLYSNIVLYLVIHITNIAKRSLSKQKKKHVTHIT